MKITKTPLSFLAVCGTEVKMLHVAEEEVQKKGILDALSPLIEQFKLKMAEKKAEKEAQKAADTDISET